jgi:hypothetical protein
VLRSAVSCCVSAAGVRFLGTLSCREFRPFTGLPHQARIPAHLPRTHSRITTFHTHETQTGPGALYPEDNGVHWPSDGPCPPPAALQRLVPVTPAPLPQPGMLCLRGISKSFLVVAPYRSFPHL